MKKKLISRVKDLLLLTVPVVVYKKIKKMNIMLWKFYSQKKMIIKARIISLTLKNVILTVNPLFVLVVVILNNKGPLF